MSKEPESLTEKERKAVATIALGAEKKNKKLIGELKEKAKPYLEKLGK